jgi:hypothetical protein
MLRLNNTAQGQVLFRNLLLILPRQINATRHSVYRGLWLWQMCGMNVFWPASTSERIAYPMKALRLTHDTDIKKNYVRLQTNKLLRYCKKLTWLINLLSQNKLHNVQGFSSACLEVFIPSFMEPIFVGGCEG